MHPERAKRVLAQLKDAEALSLEAKLDCKLGRLPVKFTLEFRKMPTLLYQANGKRVVKCLPLNQLGMGDTDDDAFEMLAEDLEDMFFEAIAGSNLAERVVELLQGMAARLYWDKHEELQKKQHEEASKTRGLRTPNLDLERTTATQVNPALLAEYQEFSLPAQMARET